MGEDNKKRWNLYILRYNCFGNYYVGITENLEKRMLVHWRRKSNRKGLPIWSSINKSGKGFKFYWFEIDKDVVSQSLADRCENQLAKLLIDKIKEFNTEKIFVEIHVGNGKFVDSEENNYDVNNTFDNFIKRDIDNEIEAFFKNPTSLILEKVNEEILIRNIKIGNIGEYDISQCNKKWDDVVKGN